jgi:MFS family permease
VLIWQIGILLGANRLVRIVTNELAGRLIKRVGSRKPLLLAVMVGSLTTMGYALPLGFWWLFSLRLIWGSCWSVLRAEGYLTAIDLSDSRNRGRIIGIYQTITRAGSGGGVLLGGFLTDLIGIPYTFFIYGLISMASLSVLLSLKIGSEGGAEEGKTDSVNPELTSAKSLGKTSSASRLKLLVWYGGMSVVLVEHMLVNLTGRIVADSVIANLHGLLGVSSLTGIILGFRSIGMLVMGPGFGALGDVVERKKLLSLSLAGELAVLLLMMVLRSWISYLLLLLFFIVFASANRVGIYALMVEEVSAGNHGEARALHINRFATFIDIGMFLGPVVGFSLYASYGLVSILLLSALLLLPSLAGILVLSFESSSHL